MTNTSAARPVLNGRYELHRRIARGGMADVFLAKDQLLDRPVAVKVLFPQYASDPTFVARFRREAQAAANLNHPSIVAVYDWGEHDGTYFIVMEYVEGQTLADLIATQAPLDPRRAAGIATEVAVALGFAHRNGTVHRDVKPGNIMINTSGQIKVADFGIARAFGGADEELTQTGSVMGTASYFSPEQAQGKVVDPRSDLYSLGVVLFEMLVGQTPFVGNTPVAIAYKHVQEAPPRAASINPSIPPAMDALISRLLQKDPAMRYPAAEEVRADLIRFQEGQPMLGISGQAAQSPATGGYPAYPTNAVPGAPGMAGGYGMPSDSTTVMNTTGQNPAYRNPDTGTSRAVIDTSRAMPATAAVTQVEPVEEYYEPPSRTGVFVVMLGVLLMGMVGLIYWLSGFSGDDTNAEETVEMAQVPRVVGQTYASARNAMEDAGFDVVPVYEENEAPENEVFNTNPEGGTEAEVGSEVTLFVSKPLDLVPIPDVAGMTLEEAQDVLSELGIRTSIQREWDDTVPEDSVIGTNPAIGTEVSTSGDFIVELIVSQGPQEQVVPNVAGMTQIEAGNALTSAGFTNYRFEPESSASVGKDRVIRTEPAIGQPSSLSNQVLVYVSTGAGTVKVPNIYGKDQATADEALRSVQLVPQFEPIDLPPGDPNIGLVVDVQPAPETELRQGETVSVKIGRAGQQPTTTTQESTTTSESTTTTAESTTSSAEG